MNRVTIFGAALLLGAASLVAACNGDAPAATPTATGTPTPAGTATPANGTATPTPVASACPEPGSPSLPASAPDFGALEDTIRAFLSDGGSPDALASSLEAWGVIGQNGGTVDASADLTGDGEPEVVVVALDVERAQVFGAPGTVWVFGCHDGAYRTMHSSAALEDHEDETAELVSLEDLTGDGTQDLLYTLTICGAHTCGLSVFAYGYAPASDELVSLIAEPIEFVPYGEVGVSGASGGPRELVVDVGTIGSVGAGPQREYRDTYTWNGGAFTRSEREVTTPREFWYAIHFIQDADAVANTGDYAAALALYEEVLLDPPSETWVENEIPRLQTYARYRTMVTYAAAGEHANAAAAATVFAEHTTEGDPPGFLDIGRAFWLAYVPTRDGPGVAAGCAAAIGYAEANPVSYEVLNEFGYANPVYEPTHLCPK